MTADGRLAHDAIVVGAGPAGVLVTEQLRARGLRVLLIEAGGRERSRTLTAQDDPRWRFQCIGARAQWWRAHGVGGNTRLWGGWASRFPEAVLRQGGWPYGRETLDPLYTCVERWLGVREGRLDPRYRRAAALLGTPVLPRRNARLGRGTWTARHPAAARTARTRTVATAIELCAERARSLEVIARDGSPRTLHARAVVLAASPIETYRLLAQSGVRHPALGRDLADHLVANALLIEPRAERPQGERGPFPGSAFLPRFRSASSATAADTADFSIEAVGPWPLRSLDPRLREALGLRERRGASVTTLHAIGERVRHPARFVDLAPSARDALGRRAPRIHLPPCPADARLATAMSAALVQVAEAIASPGSELVQYRDPLRDALVFHPSGTCRMGGADAPCDPHGRVRALQNVWIADASVFPSAGDRHPTLTLLAHALRVARAVADHLSSPTWRASR